MPDKAWFATKIKNSPGIFVGQHRNVAGGLRVQEVEDRPQDRPLHQGFRGRKPQPASASRKSSVEPMTSKLYVLRLNNVRHEKSPNEKNSTSPKNFPLSLHLSLCSPDGTAMIFFLQCFLPPYTAALGFKPTSVELLQTGTFEGCSPH